MLASTRVKRLQREDLGQDKLVCAEDLPAGKALARFGARERLTAPSYLTVQVSETEHILLDPPILQYVNHSCSPNVYFDTATWELVSLQPIRAGEELTYFYPSSEWDMARGFRCQCGHAQCLGTIQGARYLDPRTLERFRLTPHVRRLAGLEPRQGET